MRWAWIWRMAWRDGRRETGRLLLYISSIIIGIAALVALNAFNHNLAREIDIQAASLLGADMEIQSNLPLSHEAKEFIDSITQLSTGQAREERFISMIKFPTQNVSRLAQIKGVSADFPFYGGYQTEGDGLVKSNATRGKIYIDKSLSVQSGAGKSDSAFIGTQSFVISDIITKGPGQSSVASSMMPSVILPLSQINELGLKQMGSRIEYRYYFKFPRGYEVDSFVERHKDRLENLQLRFSTVQSTKENTGRSFDDVGKFMQLVGFVALLLGAVGVSSAVNIFVREKIVSVSILRCLGSSAKTAFQIFLVQFAVVGLIAGIIGSLLGTIIQYVIPLVVQDFLPVDVEVEISWSAVLQGILIGLCFSVLFALLPLLSLRFISPLNTLRRQSQSEGPFSKDRLRWVVVAAMTLFIFVFAKMQLESWTETVFFVVAVGVVFLLLYAVSILLIGGVRRFFPHSWSFEWRQGLANLFRPQNQTTTVILSIGFATVLIATLFLVQDMLLQRINVSNSEGQPNLVLFDVQQSQVDSLTNLLDENEIRVQDHIPIVTLKIEEVNGRRAKDIANKKDTTSALNERAFRGEIRATYRDTLYASEKITDGKWLGESTGDLGTVSLENDYAKRIGVSLGDTLTLNVQGVLLKVKVSSFRKVDWNRFQTNFRMVLAKGIVDDAPQTSVFMIHASDEENAAHVQQLVVNNFPNVSVIDIHVALKILDDLLGQMAFVIQFIGGFSILTGIIVLISSIMITKYQRLQENILLKTLGATRSKIVKVIIAEYLFLGILSALTGVIIALVLSYAMSVFVFDISFVPDFLMLLAIILIVTMFTVVIGILNSLSILRRPAMESLRR